MKTEERKKELAKILKNNVCAICGEHFNFKKNVILVGIYDKEEKGNKDMANKIAFIHQGQCDNNFKHFIKNSDKYKEWWNFVINPTDNSLKWLSDNYKYLAFYKYNVSEKLTIPLKYIFRQFFELWEKINNEKQGTKNV